MYATIEFLAPCTRKPVFHDGCSDSDYLPLEARRVRIDDVRAEAAEYTLDRQGFALVDAPSSITNMFCPAGRAEYRREIEALIVRLTGADKAIALANGVIRRSARAAGYGQDGTTVPGRFAHCDFSPNPPGSRFWVEKLLSRDEARARLERRFAFYNVWRSLTPPPQDTPLALCDARSVAADDAVACDQEIREPDGTRIVFELSVFRYNPAQRWCYFSGIDPQEALIFKGFDSDPSRAGGVAHAAFDAPDCPAAAPARESIDERVIAFFD